VELRVFVFHVRDAFDKRDVHVVVAAAREADAARLVRAAGWTGARWRHARLTTDADEYTVAMSEPGSVWCYPWGQAPPRTWNRIRSAAA
jgi:hypothetical protein